MKNIHILPTNIFRDVKLSLFENKLYLGDFASTAIPQNIYITSDEEIKEGDWFYNTISLKPEPFKACENGDGYVNCSKYSHYRIDCKKIILTTDGDLIKDNVQAIDDEFLEWFVNNSSCEEVKVRKNPKVHFIVKGKGVKGFNQGYKIIIPKEEPKQETLEKAAERILSKEGIKLHPSGLETYLKGNVINAMVEMSKWQQEQILQFLYSEITERRPYSSSKMCEKVIEFIEQLNTKK